MHNTSSDTRMTVMTDCRNVVVCLLQTALGKPTGMAWPFYQEIAICIHNQMKRPSSNLRLAKAVRPTAAGLDTPTCLETYKEIVCQVLSGEAKDQLVYLSAMLHILNPAKHAWHRCLTSQTVRLLNKPTQQVILAATNKHFHLLLRCTTMEVCVLHTVVK